MSKDRVKGSGKWVYLQLVTILRWQQAKVKSTKSNPENVQKVHSRPKLPYLYLLPKLNKYAKSIL